MSLHMDKTLAARLDAALVAEGQAYIDAWNRCRPEDAPVSKRLRSGALLFAGRDSPVTQAVGLGLSGPIRADEVDVLEAFFAERGAAARVAVNPLADPSLLIELCRRGYVLREFENVLVRTLPQGNGDPPTQTHQDALSHQHRDPPGVTIRRMHVDDLDVWSATVARGFLELPRGERPTRMGLALAEVALHIDFAESYLAEIDGVPAGGACLALHDGIATCFGAATLPEYRNRGVQSALLRHRLTRGDEAGCDLATAGAAPGAVSQRNLERLGFQVAYTMVLLELASPARPR